MENSYQPEYFEKSIYETWKKKGFFSAKVDKNKKKFSMVMPPPNVTGQLHIGHALNNTIQDIIIRHKRMQGYSALWVPGTDHAAIATEAKVVEKLAKQGKTKQEVGRDEFLKLGWDWYKKFGNRICSQLEALGVSPDWDRLSFTMDENLNRAVRHAFVHYYNKGWIYRGKRVVNWCPHCKSAISDMENIYEQRSTFLWYIKYPFEDGTGYVEIATTRPETLFADSAVAVNPKDERYKNLIGKNLCLPLTNRKIPLIADEYCEIGFGTGAVKITPAHDANDYEVGLRHDLPIFSCINDDGKLNEIAGEFAGLEREEARLLVEKKLSDLGFLIKKEKYLHNVGTCQRCNTVTEPKISIQWWVKMQELAKPAVDALKNNDIKFVPSRFEKQYLNWLINIKDWCISRQLWLGHRIPAYYCKSCGEMFVCEDEPHFCPKCHSSNFIQDEDVLDTWFSSALWPFSTLGYPNKTPELEYFYPTDVLVTAYDIISFWVSKMVYSGLEFMGKCPFKKVLINGIVRDKFGSKMSKSLGNGVDPLELIDKYGADSLRYSLVSGLSMGIDLKYDEEKTKQSKLFLNKLYNAGKYVLHAASIDNYDDFEQFLIANKNKLSISDKWIITKVNKLSKEINRNLEKYELGVAINKLTSFVWNTFCDWYIEISKVQLKDEQQAMVTKYVLLYVFDKTLKLLHPFVPFITEYIYQNLPIHSETIMLENYPICNEKLVFVKATKFFEEIILAIKTIRNYRAENKISESTKIKLFILPHKEESQIISILPQIEKLCMAKDIEVISCEQLNSVKFVFELFTLFVKNENLLDESKINEQIKTLTFEIERSQKMLTNEGFLKKAPQALVDKEREKLEKNKELLNKLKK